MYNDFKLEKKRLASNLYLFPQNLHNPFSWPSTSQFHSCKFSGVTFSTDYKNNLGIFHHSTNKATFYRFYENVLQRKAAYYVLIYGKLRFIQTSLTLMKFWFTFFFLE